MLPDPCRVLDRVVDVVKEYLPDPGAALGEPAAEILEPAVVGLDAGAAALVLVRLRRAREQDEARGERRGPCWGEGPPHKPPPLLPPGSALRCPPPRSAR